MFLPLSFVPREGINWEIWRIPWGKTCRSSAEILRGEHYSRNSMKAILAGLERYLTQAPHRKAFSIIQDKVFAPANEALDSHLKRLAKTGVLSSTKHKPALEREDVEQLFAARQLGNDTPESVLQSAWFYLMLYFGRRGRENQRNMVKEDIVGTQF